MKMCKHLELSKAVLRIDDSQWESVTKFEMITDVCSK